jgi:hypothetical protein
MPKVKELHQRAVWKDETRKISRCRLLKILPSLNNFDLKGSLSGREACFVKFAAVLHLALNSLELAPSFCIFGFCYEKCVCYIAVDSCSFHLL